MEKTGSDLKGRVLAIKSLLIPQIGFEIEMRSVHKNILKIIENLIWNFL